MRSQRCPMINVYLPDPGAFVCAEESAEIVPTLIHPFLRLVDYLVKLYVVFYSFT